MAERELKRKTTTERTDNEIHDAGRHEPAGDPTETVVGEVLDERVVRSDEASLHRSGGYRPSVRLLARRRRPGRTEH